MKFDFSTLLVPRSQFLGYIGSTFRRLKIYFTAISKNPNDETVYEIEGLSLAGNNKCRFSGSINIIQVREYKAMHYGVDGQYEKAGLVAQGVLIGAYRFKEDSEQKHSGVFEGIMTLSWYLDKDRILHYDKIDWFSDSYRNNQYVGSWTAHDGKTTQVCNWGEYRIPFSEELDIGEGEFVPNPKYYQYGWGSEKYWVH